MVPPDTLNAHFTVSYMCECLGSHRLKLVLADDNNNIYDKSLEKNKMLTFMHNDTFNHTI